MNTTMLIRVYYLFLILSLSVLVSCYYDSEEDLYPTVNCSTENMSYMSNILPIIQNRCYKCHDAATNNGGITLEGYENIKRYVDNGELKGAVTHTPGFSPMPQNEPKLPQCEVEKIVSWIDSGGLNN